MADMRYTIGQLAGLTGLPVRTIRFYSDEGVLPPAGRTAAGYRLYGEADRVRLELVRKLRDVGFDLPTIRALVERDLPMDRAVDLQLRAVEAQLRTLRVARAVLRRAQARGGEDAAHLGMLHALARLGAAERARLVAAFWDDATAGMYVDEDWVRAMSQASVPELPEDPTAEQLEAWLELAELATDTDFHAALRKESAPLWSGEGPEVDHRAWNAANQAVMEDVEAALRAGVAPDDAAAVPLVDRFVELAAAGCGRSSDVRFRSELLEGFEAHDPRAERWWELVAILRGCPSPQPTIAAYHWLSAALRATTVRPVQTSGRG